MPYHRLKAARALRDYPRDSQASEALIAALGDPEPAVRYAAAESLENHFVVKLLSLVPLPGNSDFPFGLARRNEACLALVSLLDDGQRGRIELPANRIFGPGRVQRRPALRARALLTLTALTGRDFGFDQQAWRDFIKSSNASVAKMHRAIREAPPEPAEPPPG
jgi:hypothetical protein